MIYGCGGRQSYHMYVAYQRVPPRCPRTRSERPLANTDATRLTVQALAGPVRWAHSVRVRFIYLLSDLIRGQLVLFRPFACKGRDDSAMKRCTYVEGAARRSSAPTPNFTLLPLQALFSCVVDCIVSQHDGRHQCITACHYYDRPHPSSYKPDTLECLVSNIFSLFLLRPCFFPFPFSRSRSSSSQFPSLREEHSLRSRLSTSTPMERDIGTPVVVAV